MYKETVMLARIVNEKFINLVILLRNCVLYYCSFAYSHRNAFGRNQKLNISLERGQVDSMFRINYTDPWIEGDDKRTSRSINIQVRLEIYWV